MSLKNLLPEGCFDEILKESHLKDSDILNSSQKKKEKLVRCPNCGKEIVYSTDNPFRPFCSERCKLIDLGAWANEERVIKGRKVDEDEDSDLLSDPNLPKRHEI